MVDMAIQQIGAVSVPVYPNITNNELKFILQDANVKMIFVGDHSLFNKLNEFKDELPALEKVYSFKEVPGVPQLQELMVDPSAEGETGSRSAQSECTGNRSCNHSLYFRYYRNSKRRHAFTSKYCK